MRYLVVASLVAFGVYMSDEKTDLFYFSMGKL